MMRKSTTAILAVALSATACGGVAESTKAESSKQDLADEQVQPAKPSATPSATPSAMPSAKPACDLESLNAELSMTMRDETLKEHEHFRCLCDDKGYPLVGNINGKSLNTASEFCSALKEKGLL